MTDLEKALQVNESILSTRLFLFLVVACGIGMAGGYFMGRYGQPETRTIIATPADVEMPQKYGNTESRDDTPTPTPTKKPKWRVI